MSNQRHRGFVSLKGGTKPFLFTFHIGIGCFRSRELKMSEELFGCGGSFPLNEAVKQMYIWEHKQKRKLVHNCAGKHIAFLA